MIARGLRLAIDEGIRGIKEIAYDGTLEFMTHYLSFDDERVVSRIIDHGRGAESAAASIFQRLRDRRLLKELAVIPLVDSEFADRHALDRLQRSDSEDIGKLEAAIADELGYSAWEVAVIIKSVKNPVYEDPIELDKEQVFVLMRDGGVKRMGDLPHLMNAAFPTDQRLHVMGPRGSLDEMGHRRKYRCKQGLALRVKEFVKEFAQGE